MVGRAADVVVVSDEERRFLEGQVRRHKAPRSLSDRCRMILLCAEGLPSKEVAAQLGVHEHTVGKWRRRFVRERIEGLTDEYRPGRPRTVADEQVAEVEGVSVRMLTNSLEPTDVLPVHAGYSKRRTDLLRAGVGLFELRTQAAGASDRDRLGPLGSSGSNLHAKTFAVDGARIFVGSFNFDPRSATINTEMGLVIESERMAGALHRAFDQGLRGFAWQVQLQDNKPVWVDLLGQTEMSKSRAQHSPSGLPFGSLAGCL